MPPTTTSISLIDLVLAELQAHLPDALEDAGLPAVVDWTFGDRDLVATSRCPQIQVDHAGYSQVGRFADDMRRENSILVIALIAAVDPETLHRYLLGYGDVICATLESELTPRLHVTSVDPTSSFRFEGAHGLFRAVVIEATLPGTIHHKGAV